MNEIAHPVHYCEGRKYEPKDVIRDWELNFNLGCVVKYVSRAGRKGDIVEDLKKARQYIDYEIEALEADAEVVKPIDITLLSIGEYGAAREYISVVDDWWWLRSPGFNSFSAAYVNYGGSVSRFGNDVNSDLGAVRPALQFGPNAALKIGDKLSYAGYSWTVIAPDIALCDDIIGHTCFDIQCNNYYSSLVHGWLHDWAEKNGIKL